MPGPSDQQLNELTADVNFIGQVANGPANLNGDGTTTNRSGFRTRTLPKLLADASALALQITTQFGITPFYGTRAQGVAAIPVNSYFSSAETGTLRTYQRTNSSPFYQDMGDAAAPTTAQSLALPAAAAGIGFTNPGSGAVAQTVADKLAQSVSILDFMTPAQRNDALMGFGQIDCYAAIMAAINSATYGSGFLVRGPRIHFPNGKYRCDTTIQLKKSVVLWGEGAALPYSPMPTIVFPAGVTGIIVHAYNTIGNTTESTPTTAGAGSIIEGIALQGAYGTADQYGGHGIWLRGKAYIRSVYTVGFQGHGRYVFASAGSGGASEGNANNWRDDNGASYNNKGCGLRAVGADANAGRVSSLDCSGNAQWGIYDTSFLANTYEACHTSGNVLGPYSTEGSTAPVLFNGCYAESDQGPSIFGPGTIVLGGTLASGAKGPGAWITNSQGQISVQYQSGMGGTPPKFGLIDQTVGFGMRMSMDPNAYGYSVDLNDGTSQAPDWQTYGLESAGQDLRFCRAHTDQTAAAFWTRKNTARPCGPDMFDFANGYAIGGKRRVPGSAMPTSGPANGGNWNSGDFVENTAPVISGSAGSRYTVAGWFRITNGTGNVLNTDWVERRNPTGT